MRFEALLFVSIWLASPADAHRQSAAAALNVRVPSGGPPPNTHLEKKSSFANSGIPVSIMEENMMESAGNWLGMTAQYAMKKTAETAEHMKNLADNAPPIDAESLKNGAEETVKWARENPGKAALVAGSVTVIAAPALVASPALAAVGFGAQGPVAGGLAAGAQSGMGSVVAPSLFSTLQSAAMGGYGVAAVNGAVQGSAAVVGISAGATGLKEAVTEDGSGKREKHGKGDKARK